MKVLLIYPPAHHMITTNVPNVVDEHTGHYPPLGLMYVASHAEKHTNHEIEILDTQVEEMDYDVIKQEVAKRKPDVVGIQTMTFTLIDAILTAKTVKEVDKSIHVCLGGPHVNIFPEETMSIPYVDSLVLGEGEYTFADLVNSLSNGGNLNTIKGIAFKEGSKIINTGARPLIGKLDEIPFPARHLTPIKKYSSVLARRTPITTMMTSRGCPYRCSFCDRPHLGKVFRARTALNVVDEMEACVNMGISEFFLYDDTFSINKRRVSDVCDEIINRGLNIGWDIRARVDTVDEVILRKLKAAGCERIHYGVEAGTPEILQALRKDIDLEKVKEVFKMTHDMGITTLAYFMIGNPTETKEQIFKTIEFANSLNADFVHISLTTPFPATELYRQGLQSGILKSDCWREFAKDPKLDFVPALWEENLSRDELISLLKQTYKSFYTRPGYVLRQTLKVRSWSEFKRKAKAGLGLLRM